MTNRIQISGDKTLNGLSRWLMKPYGPSHSPSAYTVTFSDFNHWLLDIINPASDLYANPPEVLCVILSPRYLERPNEEILSEINTFLSNAPKVLKNTRILFSNLFVDSRSALPLTTSIDHDNTASEINLKLYEFSKMNDDFFIFDQKGLVLKKGIESLNDLPTELRASMYYSPRGIEEVAKSLIRTIDSLFGRRKKVLAVDLDNTLWGGILGEDGFDGIKIGLDNGGAAYQEFQKSLLSLKVNGILLVIVSKNNEDDAFKVIDTHPDMTLRRSDFVGFKINWDSKADNLKDLAKELNLGLDSFVFFDDSPHERSVVKSLLPEVDVIEVPKEPAFYVQEISEYKGFDSLQITDEDQNRSILYRSETSRSEALEASDSFEDYIKGLNMVAEIAAISDQNLTRALQLIQKTNQFNCCPHRYGKNELNEKISSGGYAITMRLNDRFGESGLVGVMIIDKMSGSVNSCWTIDSFLLSCRVIGRNVEEAWMDWLLEKAIEAGISNIQIRFENTGRNQVAKLFLEKFGFAQISDNDGLLSLRIPKEWRPSPLSSLIEIRDQTNFL